MNKDKYKDKYKDKDITNDLKYEFELECDNSSNTSDNSSKTKECSIVDKNKLTIVLQKLKFNRIVNYFWFSKLKEEEESWSFYLILLSTITSVLTIANNIQNEPFLHFNISVNIGLNITSISTSLIGTWMKKKNYVEKINNTDRYFQKINILCEEIEYELIKGIDDNTNKFIKTNEHTIKQHLVPNPSIMPKDWKKTVYDITKNYPELICIDGTPEHKLWPWWSINNLEKIQSTRKETNFKNNILNTKINEINKNVINKNEDIRDLI